MIGQRVLHYQILEQIGGGMGVVYKARDTHLDRFVAIKVLPPEKVADALAKAHTKGIIHPDLKPTNLMVTTVPRHEAETHDRLRTAPLAAGAAVRRAPDGPRSDRHPPHENDDPGPRRCGGIGRGRSHLLHLVEEVCSHILSLKNGKKIIDGTLEEITRRFSAQPGDANLEEVFFRATIDSASAAPPETTS